MRIYSRSRKIISLPAQEGWNRPFMKKFVVQRITRMEQGAGEIPFSTLNTAGNMHAERKESRSRSRRSMMPEKGYLQRGLSLPIPGFRTHVPKTF
jgi:hypothetical protein